tara:strand:- start:884 stop:1897 length:1014 start_codon:yes stop_codon:yes gene_type:complete
MKIAVLGCGAIGSLFLGYLSGMGQKVVGVVKEYQKDALLNEGLTIESKEGSVTVKVKADTVLREKVDLAIFATKINDLEEVIKANKQALEGAFILTTQNGLAAENILGEYFPKEKIITGIVMFGATFYPPNKVVHNFGNKLIIGDVFSDSEEVNQEILLPLSDVFEVVKINNIKGAKYLKLFINLNNCLPAIIGKSMQDTYSDLELAKLAIRLNQEAYSLVDKCNIQIQSLPNYPKERLQGFVSMPLNEAASLLSQTMANLSKEPLYGSILQSIKRERRSEIDYINGEVVKLAENNNFQAPLNKKIVQMVHAVEDRKEFFSKEDLLSQTEEVMNYER